MTRRAPALAAAALLVTLAAARADAHQVGLSRGEYLFGAGVLRLEITFARGELLSIAPGLDRNGDGKLEAFEVAAGGALVAGAVVARVRVTAGAGACDGAFEDARFTEEDGVAVRARFRCAGGAATAHVELPILDDLAHGHRHIARARGVSGDVEEVLYRGRSGFDVPPAPADALEAFDRRAGGTTPPARGDAAPTTGAAARASFADGARAVFAGHHAAAVVAGLLLFGASARARLEVAATFVLAAAVGVALAASSALAPPDRVLGPALALTLVYVGLDGWVSAGRPRAFAKIAVAISLGVAHGLGIAGQAAVPGAGFVLGALLTLAGVCGVMTGVAPVLEAKSAGRIASAAIALGGVAVFAARVAR